MRVRSLITALLVLVMVGSIISPALAISTEQKVPAGKTKIVVVEVTGIKKNEILAKALKNEDVKKLKTMSIAKGYKIDLLKAKVVNIIDRRGIVRVVVIPAKSDTGRLMLVYISEKNFVKVGAVEIAKNRGFKQIKIYYVDYDGKVKSKTYTIQDFSECSKCVWSCTFNCILQNCVVPEPPSVCSLCQPLLECCLPAPVPDNPCCAGAIICYGAMATGCHLWCIYDCGQKGECP